MFEYNLTKSKVEYYLCKPDFNRTIIGKLTSAYLYGGKVKLKTGNINELEFRIPLWTEENNEIVKNKYFDLIKEEYIIKLIINDTYTEYFSINKVSKVGNDEFEEKQVSCLSLGIELADKLLINYSTTAKNATQLLNEVLTETIWGVDYIDADFDLMYRSPETNSSTVLDMVFTIAKAFGAVIVFDTVNRKISFYKEENLGINRGLHFSFGRYLREINSEYDMENFCTRLKVFGKDSITFNSVNVTGQNYIEDYSWYMYPYQEDENGNVISHSDYMSDSLAGAIIDYQELIESKTGEFNTLLTQKQGYKTILTTKQNELDVLITELHIIEDSLAVANASGQPTGVLITQKNNKQAEIDAKQIEIDNINAQISAVDNQITTLRNSLAIENNFTADQITEWNKWIKVREVTNDLIEDEQELYNWAVTEFSKKHKIPSIVLKINIVDLFKCANIEALIDRNKLALNEIVNINYERMGVQFEAKIIELEIDFDNEDGLNIVIANTKDILTDKEKFIEMYNRAVSTSTTIDMNKYKWNDSVTKSNEISAIIESTWNAIERQIKAGVNESVEIGRNGIIVRDPNNPNDILIMQHGLVACSNNNGNTWQTAISPYGVIADRLIGKILLGNNLIIGDDNGTFEIVGNLLTVKDNLGNTRVKLGNYATNKYGLELRSKTGNTVILDEDGLITAYTEGRTDNVDATHPLVLNVYVPPETLSIHKAILRFKLQAFRAYEQGVASGGGGAVTSASGGNKIVTSEVGGDDAENFVTIGGSFTQGFGTTQGGFHTHDTTSSDGSHDHGAVTHDGPNHEHTIWAHGQHDHFVESDGSDHTHDIPNHYHPHTHNVTLPSHTHSVSVPNHTHDIDFGIYTSTTATGITVKINGVSRTTELGGPFSIDKTDLNIKPYLTIGQWNTIELGSSSLGRIDASIFAMIRLGV